MMHARICGRTFSSTIFYMSVVDLFFQVDAYIILFSVSHWAYWIWKVALLLLQLFHCCKQTVIIQRELVKRSIRQFL